MATNGKPAAAAATSSPLTVGKMVKSVTQWKDYTREEVAKHRTEKDLWMVIHGRVYDVTTFSEDHPGGPEILLQHAGEDATQDFEETFHSAAARKQLKDYAIGGVVGFEGNPEDAFNVKQSTAGAAAANVTTSSSSALTPAHYVVLIAVLAIVAYFVMNSS